MIIDLAGMGLLNYLPEEIFYSILSEWIDDIHSYTLLDIALTNHKERPLLFSLYDHPSFLINDEVVSLALIGQDDLILSYVNWLNHRHLKLKKMFLPLSSLQRLVSLSPLITSQLHEIEVYQSHYQEYNLYDFDRPEEAFSILDLQNFLFQCPKLISLNLQGWEGLTDDNLTALTYPHPHYSTDSSTHNSTESAMYSSYCLALERLDINFSAEIVSMINLIEFITSFQKTLLHLSIYGYLLTENYLMKLTACEKLESLLISFSLSYHSEEDFLTFLHCFQSLKQLNLFIVDNGNETERMLLRIAHQHGHTLISYAIMDISLSMKTVKEILSVCPYLITFQCMNCQVQVINSEEIVKIAFNITERMEGVDDIVMLLAPQYHPTKGLHLSFAGQPISSTHLLVVAETVGRRLQSLEVVVEDNCHDDVMTKVGRLCPFLSHLKIISSFCIQLSDQFLEDISVGLKYLTSITLFGLSNITHKGLASIVKERAGHLEELCVIGSNAIIDDDFLLLLEQCCGNCLKSLTLKGAMLSAESVVAMIKRNSLKCLNNCTLDQNVISKVKALWTSADDVQSPLYQYWMQRLSYKAVYVM